MHDRKCGGADGRYSFSDGTYTIAASGRDIWNTSDECRYVFNALRGDGSVTVRVSGINRTHSWAKAGVMFRESLSDGSRFAFMCVTPGQGVSFQRRTNTYGSPASTTISGIAAPQWVRLTRSGDTLTGEVSADGTTWTQVGAATVSMGNDAFVGLAVTSHKDGVFTTATADGLTVDGTPTPEGEWPAMNLPHSMGGRVTRIEDRNGYGTTIAYKSFTAEEIELSPERQLQIDTVTDAYGRSMTFSYHAAQVAGNWVVSSVLPTGGSPVEYQYEDGKLSHVAYPDGTMANFGYGVNAVSSCATVSYEDPGDADGHVRKTVYLTSNLGITNPNEDTAEVVPQAAMLVKMVVNGDDEVSYFRMNNPNHVSLNEHFIYEGGGRARLLHACWSDRYYKGWMDDNGSEPGFCGHIGAVGIDV